MSTTDLIVDLVDPYSKHKEEFTEYRERFREAHSVFLGYDSDIFKNIPRTASPTLTEYLKILFLRTHVTKARDISNKVCQSKLLNKKPIHLLPNTV